MLVGGWLIFNIIIMKGRELDFILLKKKKPPLKLGIK